jgi:hypothetical protein
MGGLLEITLMPDISPELIPENHFTNLALLMRRVNSEFGVGVLLRFMHEMNGSWMVYGLKPIQQIEAWIKLTTSIRSVTNMTAMVWSPNIGGGYPFRGAGYDFRIPTPQTDPENFAVMDTDGNGVITREDDPYLPFYPGMQSVNSGDEYVDWIGISLYSYRTLNHQLIPSSPGTLTSTKPNEVVSLYGGRYPFYPRWVESLGKPFMFSETGAAVAYNLPDQPAVITEPVTVQHEIAVKRAWWTEVLESSIYADENTKLSHLKAAVWFEESKKERSYDDANLSVFKDYRITFNETVRNVLLSDLRNAGDRISYGGKFAFKCNGEFTFNKK